MLLVLANRFHSSVSIGPLSSIEVSSRGTNTEIGAGSVVDDFVKIKHVAGSGHIVIGRRCYINSGTVLYSGNGVKMGDDVLIGPNCSLVPVNHQYTDRAKTIREQRYQPSRGGS